MKIITASGKEYDLDFEPINSLIKSRVSFTKLIINQINSGIYNDSICKNGIILDAGANVGLFSIYASSVATKVYAIEPTLEHYNNLVTIMDKLKITNVIPINAALWKETGTVRFNLIGGNTTMNSIKNHSDNYVSVSSIDLPTFFETYGIEMIDYFKCDIEGAEIELIEDDKFEQMSSRISNLFLEVHGTNMNALATCMENKLRKLFPVVIRRSIDTIIAKREQ